MSATLWLAKKSGDNLDSAIISKKVLEMRKARDAEDRKAAVEDAKIVLNKVSATKNPVNTRTKQWTLKRDERKFLLGVFVDKEYLIGRGWTKKFYEMVDGNDGYEGDKLRSIESSIFHDKFKENSWEGTKQQNKEADLKIAGAVRYSLKISEQEKLLKLEK